MKIIDFLKKIISKLESLEISFPHFLLTFGALVIIRALLEGFAYESYSLPSYITLFLLSPLFYINVLLSIFLVLTWLTKIKLRESAGIILAGFTLAFVNPIIHLFSSQKFVFSSLVVTSDNILRKFFTFLFDTDKLDLTLAAKIQVALFIIFVTFYVFWKTRNWWKTILAFIITYAIGFFYSTPLFVVSIFSIAIRKGVWDVSLMEILDFFGQPPGFLIIRYPDTGSFSAILGSTILLTLLIIQLLLTYRICSREKFLALGKSVRFTRLLTQFFIFLSGAVFAYTKLDNKNIWSFDFVMMAIMATGAVLSSWLFSVYLNDIADQRIDRISNAERPLPRGIINVNEARNLAIVTALLTLAMALTLGFNLFFLFLVILALGYIYSAPPLRLKKWFLLSNLAMTTSGTILFVIGYLLVNANNAITNLPQNIVILAFCVLFLLSSIKDLKDYQGDPVDKVTTVFTIFGLRRGKLIIAIATFVALMLFPIILKNPDLLLISISFGIAEFFLIFDRKLREKWIVILLFVYVILAYLIAF
jgi:4-hydroxybenzoate polyprenyltransferase